jgi:hypothetical protein
VEREGRHPQQAGWDCGCGYGCSNVSIRMLVWRVEGSSGAGVWRGRDATHRGLDGAAGACLAVSVVPVRMLVWRVEGSWGAVWRVEGEGRHPQGAGWTAGALVPGTACRSAAGAANPAAALHNHLLLLAFAEPPQLSLNPIAIMMMLRHK